MNNSLIIPSEIPWDSIKGKDLEELLYWLFDSMGAKNLEWRIGGKGAGASDQGRDLECTFYISSPEGDLVNQNWWIEAKGRKTTVEPSEVKESVFNASGKNNIDVLVIATNSVFSNPTRDWVKEWQVTNKRPVIKLWEQTNLEKHCSKNPLSIIRLYSKALSSQGKLEVIRTKFWNYAGFTDEPTLKDVWNHKKDLKISPEILLALVASEFANGNISSRPWAAHISGELLLTTFSNALVNYFYMLIRADEAGVKHLPYLKACSYLVLLSICQFGPEVTTKLVNNVWEAVEGQEYPGEIKKYALRPILGLLASEIRDVCSNDCDRVLTDPVELTKYEIEIYWKRLTVEGIEEEEDAEILSIESHGKPCSIGFSLNKEVSCPICNLNNPENNIPELMATIDKIVRAKST